MEQQFQWHVPRAFDLCITHVGTLGRTIIIPTSSVSENTSDRVLPIRTPAIWESKQV